MKLRCCLMLMIVLILPSCVIKNENDILFTTFYGEVVVTPDHVWGGVEVIMRIAPLDLGNGLSVSSESTINGENAIRSITYYLDGEEIASSSDANADYVAKSVIPDISYGEHVVTAEFIPDKGAIIEGFIKSAKIYCFVEPVY